MTEQHYPYDSDPFGTRVREIFRDAEAPPPPRVADGVNAWLDLQEERKRRRAAAYWRQGLAAGFALLALCAGAWFMTRPDDAPDTEQPLADNFGELAPGGYDPHAAYAPNQTPSATMRPGDGAETSAAPRLAQQNASGVGHRNAGESAPPNPEATRESMPNGGGRANAVNSSGGGAPPRSSEPETSALNAGGNPVGPNAAADRSAETPAFAEEKRLAPLESPEETPAETPAPMLAEAEAATGQQEQHEQETAASREKSLVVKQKPAEQTQIPPPAEIDWTDERETNRWTARAGIGSALMADSRQPAAMTADQFYENASNRNMELGQGPTPANTIPPAPSLESKDDKKELKEETLARNYRDVEQSSWSVGLEFGRNFGKNWRVQTGLMFTYQRLVTEPRFVYLDARDGKTYFPHLVENPDGLYLSRADGGEAFRFVQKLYYLGAPFRLTRRFGSGKLQALVSGGVLANFFLGSEAFRDNEDLAAASLSEKYNTFFLDGLFSLGVSYQVDRRTYFTLEPNLRYAITSQTRRDIKSQHPYSVGGALTLGYLLGR